MNYIVFRQALSRHGTTWQFTARAPNSAAAKRYAARCNAESKALGYGAPYWYCAESVYNERVARGIAGALPAGGTGT